MVVSFSSSGDWRETDSFLRRMMSDDPYSAAVRFADAGVQALADATPQDSGQTALQWTYEIVPDGTGFVIWFKNGNEVDGFNVAAGLQYGHATKGGGWVSGIDYVNPAVKPIFDRMTETVWKEVTR
jgi:hypothetical protein